LFVVALPGNGFTQSETLGDEIQNEEDPGSEIEAEIGGGEAIIGRERNMLQPGEVLVPVQPVPPSPVIIGGPQQVEDLPNDPDEPNADDSIDAEEPGEGPEDLSGPDDNDPLPE
jgi:hypothetical protein